MVSTNHRSTLRILHVLAPADFGGLERVVCSLAVGQRARGHSVQVLAFLDPGRSDDHPVVRELSAHGVVVEPAEIPSRQYFRERRLMREATFRFAPDVVHFHGARVDVLDLPVARGAGYPTITTVHGFTGGGVKNRAYEFLQRRAMRRANAVVAVARSQTGVLTASGVAADRLHTIPNAFVGNGALLSRKEARDHLGLRDDAGPAVGWIGRLTPEKGADVFLDAMARLPDVPIVALIAGSGPQHTALQERARALGISDRVRWLGAMPNVARTFRAFDAVVMSSRTEGTPIVLFEAMAAGVPVIASAVGGIPDVVSNSEALLVPPDRPELLADALRSCLTDRDAAERRADAASTLVALTFALEPWLDRYEALYQSVRGVDGN